MLDAIFAALELVIAAALLVIAALAGFEIWVPSLNMIALVAFIAGADFYFRLFVRDMKKIKARDALDASRGL